MITQFFNKHFNLTTVNGVINNAWLCTFIFGLISLLFPEITIKIVFGILSLVLLCVLGVGTLRPFIR
jgi:hypothetical protein